MRGSRVSILATEKICPPDLWEAAGPPGGWRLIRSLALFVSRYSRKRMLLLLFGRERGGLIFDLVLYTVKPYFGVSEKE